MAGVVVAIVRIVAISVINSDPATKPPEVISVAKAVEAATPAKAATMKATTAAMKAATPAAKAAAVEAAAAVETSATAVETSASATAVETSTSTSAMSGGGIWLAERGNAQQSKGGGCQSPSCAGASSWFA